MPNNFVFNQTAEDLKAQIYGINGTTLTAVAVTSTGELLLSIIDTLDVSVVGTANVSVVGTANVSVVNTVNISVVNIPSVEIHSMAVVSDSLTVTTGTGAATILDEDTSQQQEYSYYVSNLGTGPITLALQIAPTDIETYFVDDNPSIVLLSNLATVLVPQKYLHFTRLSYDTGADTASFIAYYNSKV